MNFYDFVKKLEDWVLVKFIFDYYFVIIVLKLVDGYIVGGMKCGYLLKGEFDKMEKLFWGYFDEVSCDMLEVVIMVYQAIMCYWLNIIILKIV